MMQFPLTIDGVSTRVLAAGHAGPAVVFVHGLSTRADRWAAVVARLGERGFRAIAFDLPGHGLAAKPAGFDYRSPALARFCLGVLDALGIERTHLVGTSLGGHIAALAALAEPARCASLYLVAPLGLAPLSAEAGEAIRRGVRNVSVDGVRQKLRNVFVDPAFATEDLIVEESRINGSAGAVEALSALGDYMVDGLNGDLVTEELAQAAGRWPLGLLWGEQDRMVAVEVGQAAAEALGLGPLDVMPGVGHAPYVEQPDAFVERWLTFAREAA